jgi:hypothetical protein
MRATRLSRSELLGLQWEDFGHRQRAIEDSTGRVQDCDDCAPFPRALFVGRTALLLEPEVVGLDSE